MDTYNDHLHKGANPKLYELAKELKRDQTEAEDRLWQCLRNNKLNGLKFRRQHPLFNYIVDFYCHEKKLVVEVDGSVHTTLESIEYDNGRTYELKQLGITVLRFWNDDVINSVERVLKQILEAAQRI